VKCSHKEGAPCIGIDGNWICNKVGCDPNRLLKIAKVFEAQGIDNIIIFDGFFRHHSKRASTKRSADCERLESKQSRQEQH